MPHKQHKSTTQTNITSSWSSLVSSSSRLLRLMQSIRSLKSIDFVENPSERPRHGVPLPATCRGEAQRCATSPTQNQLKCCGSLVCQPAETEQSESGVEDGKCVATTPDNRPSGPSGRAANNNDQVCQLKGDACSNKIPSSAAKCCNDGVTYNLVCKGGFFGRCEEATSTPDVID